MDNTILLYINFFALILNMRLIYMSYKRNKFVNLIYYFVFLFLVTGQSLNISFNLQQDHAVFYQSNRITGDGHLISSIYLVYCMFIFYIYEYLYKKRNAQRELLNLKKLNFKKLSERNIKFSWIYYAVNWGMFFLFSLSMVLLVGLNDIVDSSRPSASGSTFFLIGLSLCVYPFIIKIISNAALTWKETTLFIITFLFTLLFSRMVAIFHLMLVLVTGYYSGYNRYRVPLKKYKKYFLFIPLILIVFFFGYGTWRHLKNFEAAQGLSIGDLISYAQQHPENTLFSIDVNYKLGIEGISGLSGIMTQFVEKPVVKLDWGLSALNGFIVLIPSFIRGPFLNILDGAYWYNGSIVGSGIEASFVHFSFLGLLVYPIFLGWYFNSLNKKITKKTNIGLSILPSYVFIIYGLLIIRGSSRDFLFFIIANWIIVKLAILILKIFNHTPKLK